MKLLDEIALAVNHTEIADRLMGLPVWSQAGPEGVFMKAHYDAIGNLIATIRLDGGDLIFVPADTLFLGVRRFTPLGDYPSLSITDRRRRRLIKRLMDEGTDRIMEAYQMVERHLIAPNVIDKPRLEAYGAMLLEAARRLWENEHG